MHKDYIPNQGSWIFKIMDQILWNNSVLFYSFCAFFIFLLEKSSGADLQYEACKPRHCVNNIGPIIKFPFYIKGVQPSVCGSPGFEVNCSISDGFPRIHIPENDYVIEQINYISGSIRVYNAAVLDIGSDCFQQIKNVTLPSIQFQYFDSSSVVSLHIFRGYIIDSEWVGYIYCSNDSETYTVVVDDDYADYVLRNSCTTHVVAPGESPVRTNGSNVSENYRRFLRRGFDLKWSASECIGCEQSGGRCGFNTTAYSFICFCPGGPYVSVCERGKMTVVAVVLGIFSATVLVLLVLILYFKRKHLIRFWIKVSKKNQNVEALLKSYGLLAPKRCSYSSVKKMTNGFKDKLGQGGFGSVYKGQLHDGTIVAVKILNESKANGEDFINEVVSVGRTSHVNIVALLGFSFEGSKRALIYEFMPNGSLETFIYNKSSMKKKPLGWQTLFQITVGVARGLEYLHQGCNTRILHFDIKPHNILLDKDFCPKISDFGLAKLCPDRASKVSMAGTRGTAGYIAPEIFIRKFGQVSHKSDVYSYGMMVLEMIGHRRNIEVEVDRTSEIYFPHWIHNHLQLNDDEFALQDVSNEEEELVKKMIIVGLWCIQIDPTKRPSISEALAMLEGNLESLQIPPKPCLISPPVSVVNSSTAVSKDICSVSN